MSGKPSDGAPAKEPGGKLKKSSGSGRYIAFAFIALGAWVAVNAIAAQSTPRSAPPITASITRSVTVAATRAIGAPPTPAPSRTPTR